MFDNSRILYFPTPDDYILAIGALGELWTEFHIASLRAPSEVFADFILASRVAVELTTPTELVN